MQRERCCAGCELTPFGRLELEREAKGVALERDRTAHVGYTDHDVVDLAEHDAPPSKNDATYGVAYRQESRGCEAPLGFKESNRVAAIQTATLFSRSSVRQHRRGSRGCLWPVSAGSALMLPPFSLLNGCHPRSVNAHCSGAPRPSLY